MRNKIVFLLVKLVILTGFYSFGQRAFKNEFGFQSDNDAYLFYGQDQYYTNGLMIYFRRATDQSRLNQKLEKFTYEISAGQKMFNPHSGSENLTQYQDRPFAGYLYTGFKTGFFYKSEELVKTGIELGTLGPNSLAEDAQKLLHKMVGFYEIEGWQYQIANALSANLSVQYSSLLHRSSNNRNDFILETYLQGGTSFTGAGLGISWRTGNLNQLFHSAYTQASVGNGVKTVPLVKRESFFYAKPQLSFVAYDATIQGSLLNSNSPLTYSPKPLVFVQQLGYMYSSDRFTFDFGLTFKSKELKSTALPHQYGSITMLYRFN